MTPTNSQTPPAAASTPLTGPAVMAAIFNGAHTHDDLCAALNIEPHPVVKVSLPLAVTLTCLVSDGMLSMKVVDAAWFYTPTRKAREMRSATA